MKFKVGDKVRIIKEEKIHPYYLKMLNELNTNKIVTIKKINKHGHFVFEEFEDKEEGITWGADGWELYIPPEPIDPIESRFEILDL